MKKFLVLYKAPTSAFEQMMKATPEQQKAGMDAWMAWSKKAASSIVDMGGPLGKSLRVTQGGSSPTSNDLGGYSILQAESKEALGDSLKGHPHFMMHEGFIEVVEVIPLGERHPRVIVAEYPDALPSRSKHRGLGKRIIRRDGLARTAAPASEMSRAF